MDRNSVIGLLLIGLIMLVSTYLFKPEEKPADPKAKTAQTPAPASNSQASAAVPVASNHSNSVGLANGAKFFGAFEPASIPQKNTFILENDLIKIVFDAKGGSPKEAYLKNFTTWDKKPLVLFRNNTFQFRLPLKDHFLTNQDLYFRRAQSPSGNELRLIAQGVAGNSIELNWSIKPGSYQVDLKSIILISPQFLNPGQNSLHVDWYQEAPGKEKNRDNERDNATVYYQLVEEELVDKINPISYDSLAFEGAAKWIGFKQQFFTSVMIPKANIQPGSFISTRPSNNAESFKNFNASLNLGINPSSGQSIDYTFYFGPTHFNTLKEVGHDLQKQIPLGWGIFGWVNKFLVIPVFNWLDGYNLNYGIVILLLTLIIKSILFPFQFKSYQSQAKMRVLKPEIDELNKKYENEDPLKKQQALMGLYKEAGVNPLGGCLPLLLQLPILLAMFNFFPNAIELRQKSFLWAEDLSTFDSIVTLPFSIPVYGDHVSLFAILMTISTIIYTMMNNQLSGANNQMPQLKWMMYLMPVIFLFVLNSYASGLNYYYFLANIITFGQQFAFTKLVDEKKIHAKIQENKKKPAVKKATGFQQKLEEMARKRGYQQPGK